MPAPSELPSLHFTRVGQGPPWLFLHAAAALGSSFSPVTARLGQEVTALVPDLLGDGKSIRSGGFDRLIERELLALHTTFARERGPLTLVGHGYGAVLALEIARCEVLEVQQLVLIEPTLFQLLSENSNHTEIAKLDAMRRACSALVAREDFEGAAREYVTYWTSEEAWNALSAQGRTDVAAGMPKAVAGLAEVFGLAVSLRDYAQLDVPTLLVRGEKSPSITRWIAAKLAVSMPSVQLFDIAGAGHMSIVTHPKEIAFLMQRAARVEPLRETLTQI